MAGVTGSTRSRKRVSAGGASWVFGRYLDECRGGGGEGPVGVVPGGGEPPVGLGVALSGHAPGARCAFAAWGAPHGSLVGEPRPRQPATSRRLRDLPYRARAGRCRVWWLAYRP